MSFILPKYRFQSFQRPSDDRLFIFLFNSNEQLVLLFKGNLVFEFFEQKLLQNFQYIDK